MLFHQCNRDRTMWEELAPRLVAAGLNVLTLDFRGYGDSGGTAKFNFPPEEGRRLVTEVWPRRGELLAAAVERQAVPGSFNSVWPSLGAGHASLRGCDFFVFAQKSMLKINGLGAQKREKINKVTNSQDDNSVCYVLHDFIPE
jgi:hypothetical protein